MRWRVFTGKHVAKLAPWPLDALSTLRFRAGGSSLPLRSSPMAGAAARFRGPGALAAAGAEAPLDGDRIVGLPDAHVDRAVLLDESRCLIRGLAHHRAQAHRLAVDHDVVAVEGVAAAAVGDDLERPRPVVPAGHRR